MRLDIERQKRLEPKRMKVAEEEILKLDYSMLIDENSITFFYKKQKVIFWPYSGYFTGKSVTAGRGLKNLLKQIKP